MKQKKGPIVIKNIMKVYAVIVEVKRNGNKLTKYFF